MVVTSVVTYTFPIGPFLGAPSSRYGPSVDWGEHYINTRGREHQLAPAADRLGQNACRFKLRFSADLVRTLIDK